MSVEPIVATPGVVLRAQPVPQRDPAPGTPRPPRHLEVAPKHSASRLRRRALARALVVLGALISTLSLFIIVASNVVMAQQSYELGTVRDRQREATRRNAELRAEVAELSSPSRIVEQAEALGMIHAERFGFVEADAEPADGVAAEPIDEVAQTLEDTAGKTRDANADTAP
jgi:cell division protein FtsL